MMDAARTRIGKITLKRGGAVQLLRRPVSVERQCIEQDIRDVLDAHGGDFAGYAIVVWAPNSDSTASARSGQDSRIPTIMVPDFVRNRLLAERIEEWSVRAVMRKLGYTPSAS